MKKELIINQKGLFLRLTGIPPVRTPVKIDITRLNMTLLLSELNMHSVVDYQIISSPETKKKKEKIKDKPIDELLYNLKNDVGSKSDNENVKKDLDEIKNLLKGLLDKPSTIIEKNIYTQGEIESKKASKRKKKISDDFIPNVNIDNLELKSSNIETIKSNSDISENVDLLSKMSKKKEK